jgi:hypothetical protein
MMPDREHGFIGVPKTVYVNRGIGKEENMKKECWKGHRQQLIRRQLRQDLSGVQEQ